MNDVTLAELRELQFERGSGSPFKDFIELQKWADRVIPRLIFDAQLQSKFKNSIAHAELHRAMSASPDEAINEAIGVLNQAITVLENKVRFSIMALEIPLPGLSELPSNTIDLPPKITIKWLYEHAPISFYFWLAGIIMSCFAAGVFIAQTGFFESTKTKPESKQVLKQAPMPSPQ